jgi:transcription initiation factor TFIIB
MRRWHSRIRVASPKERRLLNVLSKINEICSAMSLSKTVTETAAMLYRNFETMSEAKGKSITCIAAASIYLACKRCSIVRSLEEIIKTEGIIEEDRSRVVRNRHRQTLCCSYSQSFVGCSVQTNSCYPCNRPIYFETY